MCISVFVCGGVSETSEAFVSLSNSIPNSNYYYLNHKIKTLTSQTHYSIVYNISVRQSNRSVNTFLGYEPKRHSILTRLH